MNVTVPRRTAPGWVRAVLLTLMAAIAVLALPALARAANPPEPTYGSASVDGSTGEWDFSGGTTDFFAEMYRNGNAASTDEGNLYLRYDCSTQTLYALVLDSSGSTRRLRTDAPAASFVSVDGTTKVDGNSGDNGTAPDFRWVDQSGNRANGFEASAANVAPGTHTLNVETSVDNGGTQAARVPGGSVTLTIICEDLEIVKTISQVNGATYVGQAIGAGDEVTYRIAVTNVGRVGIAGSAVVVKDPHLTGANLGRIGGSGSTLDPDETWTYGISGQAAKETATCAGISNTATVDVITGEPSGNNTSTVTAVVTCPDIAATKTIASVAGVTYTGQDVLPGQLVIYAIAVTNPGNVGIPQASVVVRDPELTGGTLVRMGTGGDSSPTVLNPGDIWTYGFTQQTAAQETAACGTLQNTATVDRVTVSGKQEPESKLADNASTTPAVTVSCQPLTVAKTATASLTRTHAWRVVKGVTTGDYEQSAGGGTVPAHYIVEVNELPAVDSGWKVTGLISVQNPNAFPLDAVVVTDTLPGAVCDFGGSGTNELTVWVPAKQPGDVPEARIPYTCLFEGTPPTGALTNTAEAVFSLPSQSPQSARGTASVNFANADVTHVNGTATITDNRFGGGDVTRTPPGTTSAQAAPVIGTMSAGDPATTFAYTQDLEVPGPGAQGPCTTYANQAFADVNGLAAPFDSPYASNEVTVQVCRLDEDLVLTKTASTEWTRTYDWSVQKLLLSPATTIAPGGDASLAYLITVDRSVDHDGPWAVTGTVTVTNPATGSDVTDVVLSEGGVDNGTATCAVQGGGTVGDLAAGGVASRDYTCTYSSAPTNPLGTNAASVTWTRGGNPQGPVSTSTPFAFDTANPTTEVNASVDLTDTFNGDPSPVGTIPDDAVVVVVLGVPVPAAPGTCDTNTNTASLAYGTAPPFASAQAQPAKVCRQPQPDLSITKTAGNLTPAIGDTVGYTIQVANQSDAIDPAIGPASEPSIPAADVVVRDPRLSGLPLVYGSGDGNGNQRLDRGETWTFLVSDGQGGTLPTSETAATCGPGTNTATVDPVKGVPGLLNEADTTDNSASASFTASCQPLTAGKDAATSYTRTHAWQLAKAAGIGQYEQDSTGDSVSVDYTVEVTQLPWVDSGWAVRGVITVTNPNGHVADDVVVRDTLPGAVCSIGADDPVGGPNPYVVDVPANGQVTLNYVCAWPGDMTVPYDQTQTNTVTVTWDQPGQDPVVATKPFTFADATVTHVNDTATITDTLFGGGDVTRTPPGTTSAQAAPVIGTVSATDPGVGSTVAFTYRVSGLAVPEATSTEPCNVYSNTAYADVDGIDQGELRAQAEGPAFDSPYRSNTVSVMVCRTDEGLIVTKTVNPTLTRAFTWTVQKSVIGPDRFTTSDPAVTGATFAYQVKVAKSAGADSAWGLGGTISVVNPNAYVVNDLAIADAVDNGGTCAVAPGAATTLAPGGGTTQAAYQCTWANAPSAAVGTNTATVTATVPVVGGSPGETKAVTATGTASFGFVTPTTVVDDQVTVSDTAAEFGGPVTLGASQTFTYARTVAVPTQPGTDAAPTCQAYPNTAAITGTAGSSLSEQSSASVQACRGPAPAVAAVTTPTTPDTGITGVPNAAPRLIVTKRGPARATAGNAVVYRITVRNAGRATATGVVLTDVLPAGMSLAGRPAGARLQSARVTWSVGRLKPGASRTVSVKVRLSSGGAARRCNTVRATASNAEQATGRACTRVVPAAAEVRPAVTG